MERVQAIEEAVQACCDVGCNVEVDTFERALSEAGYVVVPKEADDVMLAAAGYGDATDEGKDYIRARYSLMIAASQPPADERG